MSNQTERSYIMGQMTASIVSRVEESEEFAANLVNNLSTLRRAAEYHAPEDSEIAALLSGINDADWSNPFSDSERSNFWLAYYHHKAAKTNSG